MCCTTYQINKAKIVRFLKFKFLVVIKLNFNGGNFIKKYKILVFTKNCKDWKRKCWLFALKFWVKNFESKILSEFILKQVWSAQNWCAFIQ